jgi:hypothetical protein
MPRAGSGLANRSSLDSGEALQPAHLEESVRLDLSVDVSVIATARRGGPA